MRKLVDLALENCSTREAFLFRIACGICGAECAGRPVRFSKAGILPETREKQILLDAVYAQEMKNARQTAIRNAAEHLNYCPICKRLVCNRCFLICDDLDMCTQCASRLNAHGSPVLSDPLEIAI